MPPAITIASLVADIASYASTGKTVADHGISLVFQKDCALLRGFEGGICLEPDPLRAAREREARNLKFDYPEEIGNHRIARGNLKFDYPEEIGNHRIARVPADPADRIAATLAFATDPEVTPRPAGRASDGALQELSYLDDSLGRAS